MKSRRNIIIAALLVVLTGVLAAFLIINGRKEKEKENELDSYSKDAMKQATEKRQVGEEIYNNLALTVEESFTGIVCWGDDSMAGNPYGNLPEQLGTAVNKMLFADLKNDLFTKAKMMNANKLNISVVNMGASDEGFREILTRTGARQLVVGEDYTIPSNTERNNITLADPDGNVMMFAKQKQAMLGDTTIAGVSGKLYYGTVYYDSMHQMLSFGRDLNGEEVKVKAGTPVYTAGAQLYREYIPVLFFAEQDGVSAEEFIAGVNEIIAIYGDGKYVIICTTESGSAYDTALSAAFGEQYIRNGKKAFDMRKDDFKNLAGQTYESLIKQGVFDKILTGTEAAKAELYEKLEIINAGGQ